MRCASYPKETPDQWPSTAAERSGWTGACNQSINIGGSLGEQSNLMSHTHRETHLPPFIWLPTPPPPPPPFCLRLKLLFGSFSDHLPGLHHGFCTTLSFTALLASCLPAFVTHPPHPSPTDISWVPEGYGTHKRLECCWVRVGGRRGQMRLMRLRENKLWSDQIVS